MNASPPPSSRGPSSSDATTGSSGQIAHGGTANDAATSPTAGGSPMPSPAPPLDAVVDPRWEMLRERLRAYGPSVAYGTFFFFVFVLSLYWTFPYERVRDRIVAEFDKSQRKGATGRQVLSIDSLQPSWFTGVVLRDVRLVTYGPDATKPPSTLRLDEVRLRVGLLSLFSTPKDVWFHAKAFGGTIDGSMTHKASATKESDSRTASAKSTGPRVDRTLKMEMSDLALSDISMVRDAIGTEVGGTLKGTVDVIYGESRNDRANGDANLEIADFWVSDGKHPFKIPALKAVFGSEEITLPQISIGDVPVTVAIRNGVAKIEKMEAKGKDLDLFVDGQVTMREPPSDSELNVGLRFKFNDSYRKKSDATVGLLLMLDSEPRLRASKRPDGFYSLRVVGPMSGTPQIVPAAGGGAGGGMGGGAMRMPSPAP